MEQQSLKGFTDELLSEDVFYCDLCKNLLNVPITLVNDVGNVCPDCCTHHNLKGINNKKFELLIGRHKLPCKFKKVGCQEQIFFNDLKVHEYSCTFRDKACLICKWEGDQSNFRSHFMRCHSNHVLENQSNLFLIDINTEDICLAKWLKGKNEFILKVDINLDMDILIYTIYSFKTNESSNNYCIIKHLGQSTIEAKCFISDINDIKETKVNLNAVKQITESFHTIKIEINLSPENEEHKLYENILQYFECPVCKIVMKPPIHQCEIGHSLCSNCKPKLENCPSCKSLIGKSKNYSLEGLSTTLNYDCKYHNLGCEETVQGQNLEKHEASCPYKPFHCPIDECQFLGRQANIVEHLTEKHKNEVIANNFLKQTKVFNSLSTLEKFYLVFDENIFRLTVKFTKKQNFWIVEVLKKKDENSIFNYEIGIIDMREPSRKLIRSELCFTNTNETDSLYTHNNCISFSYAAIDQYAYNENFIYFCQICKRQ